MSVTLDLLPSVYIKTGNQFLQAVIKQKDFFYFYIGENSISLSFFPLLFYSGMKLRGNPVGNLDGMKTLWFKW